MDTKGADLRNEMRVLVAGGAGFIGSHVCEALLGLGHSVICLDNLSTGQMRNVEPLLTDGRFEFVAGDVVAPPPIEADLILHLASPASPVHYRTYPLETMMANSLGTLRLLELAAASSARFIFASTSEVYGDPLEHPQRESYWGNVNPIGERSCYDESKRFGEALTLEFGRRGLSVAIVRIFNTYGPRMTPHDGRIVPAFIEAALSGFPFPIQGTGRQTRAFCYVSDLVEALLAIALSPVPSARVFNIGNPEEVTVLELAEEVAALVGTEPCYRFLPAVSDDPSRRCPDISHVREVFGWEPRTPLTRGLRETKKYFAALREGAAT